MLLPVSVWGLGDLAGSLRRRWLGGPLGGALCHRADRQVQPEQDRFDVRRDLGSGGSRGPGHPNLWVLELRAEVGEVALGGLVAGLGAAFKGAGGAGAFLGGGLGDVDRV